MELVVGPLPSVTLVCCASSELAATCRFIVVGALDGLTDALGESEREALADADADADADGLRELLGETEALADADGDWDALPSTRYSGAS